MLLPSRAPGIHDWKMSDGYRVRGRVWRGAAEHLHAILYLHGIQSHGGWYEGSGALLADGGATVIMPDRRGSGLNRQGRGDTPAPARWLDDLNEIAAAEQHGRPPQLDVVGVSWGGKLAVAWALQRPDLVRRLLLIAPGVWPRVDVDRRTRLRVALSLFRGGRGEFEIPLSDAALFTDNPEGRSFIEKDEEKLTRATARFLYFSTRLDARLRRSRRGRLRAAVTLLLAARDRIIDNERTTHWMRRIAESPPQIRVLDGSHSLEFEPNAEPFGTALRAWRDGRD